MQQARRVPAPVRGDTHVRRPPPPPDAAARRLPAAAAAAAAARRLASSPPPLPPARPAPGSPSDRHPRLVGARRFYECTVAGGWKDKYRAIIRDNRAKHSRWRLGPSCAQNRLVLAALEHAP